mmetsp:Transcript_54184/g.115679  ORF Transcript_54184/g.115679 Transcript_54184/m.115679 type:complete len:99 (+) Transcript_54184:173-469(+)
MERASELPGSAAQKALPQLRALIYRGVGAQKKGAGRAEKLLCTHLLTAEIRCSCIMISAPCSQFDLWKQKHFVQETARSVPVKQRAHKGSDHGKFRQG